MAENVGKRGGAWFHRLEPASRTRRAAASEARRRISYRARRQARSVERGRRRQPRTMRYAPARTFGDLAGKWLETVGPNRKASTVANYRMLVDAYLVPWIGLRRIDRVTPALIQRLYTELRSSGGRGGRPLSGTQVRNVHRVLHDIFVTHQGFA